MLVIGEVVARLRCPVCGERVAEGGGAVRCGAGHAFDVARQGYVNLLTGGPAPGTADTAAMVAERDAFLAAGHYAPIAAALARRAAEAVPGAAFTVDAGAGTGHYLRAVLDAGAAGGAGLALDVSKYALRRAARAHPRIGAAVWDVWRPLPVAAGSADLVLNVFAPRNAAEFRRVLRPGGALLTVVPTGRHLAELVGPLGLVSVDGRKAERLRGTLEPWFTAAGEERVTAELRLSPAEAESLVRMGPSARHVDPAALRDGIAALAAPGSGEVAATASVTVTTWRPRPPTATAMPTADG